MRDLGRGLVDQRADAVVVALEHQLVGRADQVVGVVGPLGEVGGEVERGLDVLGPAAVHLDGQRERLVHPRLDVLATMLEVAEDRRVDVARLVAAVENADRLVKLVGGLVVLAEVVRPVSVGIGGGRRLDRRGAGRDGNQVVFRVAIVRVLLPPARGDGPAFLGLF